MSTCVLLYVIAPIVCVSFPDSYVCNLRCCGVVNGLFNHWKLSHTQHSDSCGAAHLLLTLRTSFQWHSIALITPNTNFKPVATFFHRYVSVSMCMYVWTYASNFVGISMLSHIHTHACMVEHSILACVSLHRHTLVRTALLPSVLLSMVSIDEFKGCAYGATLELRNERAKFFNIHEALTVQSYTRVNFLMITTKNHSHCTLTAQRAACYVYVADAVGEIVE